MATMLPDPALLNNDHRQRRRMIRYCLVAFFVLLLLSLIGFIALGNSENEIDRAKAIYAQLIQKSTKSTRAELVSLFGEPTSHNTVENIRIISWRFRKQSLNQIDYYRIFLYWTDAGEVGHLQCSDEIVKGWAVWKWRWDLLKSKLGYD